MTIGSKIFQKFSLVKNLKKNMQFLTNIKDLRLFEKICKRGEERQSIFLTSNFFIIVVVL